LTASEVAQLKLNADWVCCQPATPQPLTSPAQKLARAFFYAGARALLVLHWSVDSESATRLTTSTFAIMKTDLKLGRAEALRNAMLAYMNDKGSPLNAYPAFWGPFPSLEREPRDEGARPQPSLVGPRHAGRAPPLNADRRFGLLCQAALQAAIRDIALPPAARGIRSGPPPTMTP
jgi:hypothetical protein